MKKLVCSLLALSMIICLAGCSDDGSGRSSESYGQVTEITESKDEISVSEGASTSKEQEAIDEENAWTAEETTSETNQNSESGLNGNIYSGETYTLTVNDNWSLENEDDTLDCTFNYSGYEDPKEAFTTFGIQSLPQSPDVELQELAEPMIDMYNSMDGYEVESSNKSTLNGYETYDILINYTFGGMVLKIRQTIIKNNGQIYAINSAAEESVFDDMIIKIDDILKTFKFND